MTYKLETTMNRRSFLAGTAGMSLIALHPFSAHAAGNQAHLRLMETTDLHVHVFPYDYYADKPRDTVGLARTASLIKGVRDEATNSMLLDNGDFLQGNPMGDYIAYERGMKDGDMHPVIAAMNTLGFDASTMGNHEFNFGLDALRRAEALATFPFLSANTIDEKTGKPAFPPFRIIEAGPLRIGLLGLTTPNIPGWEIATSFQAARQVSGDFYDIFQFNNSNLTTFIIADVCDKGVGAALFMVLFRSLLRAFSEREIDKDNLPDHLLDILKSTNKFISEIHGKSNMFATMFVGILDPETGILNYINGGHDPPIVLDMSGKIINKLIPTGPAVGLFPNLDFSVGKIILDDGDILYCYTDGIIDARNNDGEFFTEKKLINVISSPWSSSFSMLYDLNSNIQKHIGSQDQYDDITQFSLRRKVSIDCDVHVIFRKAILENLVELRGFAEAAAVYCCLSQERRCVLGAPGTLAETRSVSAWTNPTRGQSSRSCLWSTNGRRN